MWITDGLAAVALRDPGRPALVRGQQHVTYGELHRRAGGVAAGVAAALGDIEGETISLLESDAIEFLVAFHGIVAAGHVAAPLSPEWGPAEVARAEATCRPALRLVAGATADAPHASTLGALEGGVSRDADWRTGDAVREFYIGFSSGSTGAPKAIARSHGAWLSSFLAMSVEFDISAGSTVVVPGSLFYSFSLIAALHALFVGATVVLPAAPGSRSLLSAMAGDGLTVYALPSLLEDVVAKGGRRGSAFPGVRRIVCAGETLRPQARARAAEVFPSAEVVEYYGASELGFVTIARPEDEARQPGSVGRPFLGTAVAVLGADGAALPRGRVGLLCAKNGYGFSRYRGAEPLGDTVLGEWRTAGDLAWQDDEGYVHLAGRRDNMLVVRGENVFPEEVERVLNAEPGVRLAAVVGEPAVTPAHLVALVEPSDDALDAQGLLRACRTALGLRKTPRRVVVVRELPRTATGKLARAELRAMLDRQPPEQGQEAP